MNRIIAVITAATALMLVPATANAEPSQRSLHKEFRAAQSQQASDMRGIAPSLYKGHWHNPRFENFRRCIMQRESHGNYRAANRSSSARGAYQFLDSQWRDGLVWMMLTESRKTGDGLEPEIRRLRSKSIQSWSRYWQDRSFWTAFRNGDGAHHWHYSGSPCNRLA
jgi:hypothetical protein